MEKIKTSSIIQNLEKLTLTQEKKDLLLDNSNIEYVKLAEKNNKKFDFYRVTYKSNDHSVVGYIVQPKRLKKMTPVIIYNRGGSREFGSLKLGAIYNYLSRFAGWRYIVFASQYSGNGGSEGKDEFGGSDISDVLNIKKIIDTHQYADKERIAMIGGSRGGMMTYQCLARVKWINVAVTMAGISDLEVAAKKRPEMKKLFSEMFDNTPSEMKKRSAVNWGEKFSKKTPLLLLHGTADWRVDVSDSINLAHKLYENRIPFKLITYPGADHQLTEYKEESLSEIKDWLELYINRKSALPNLKLHGK